MPAFINPKLTDAGKAAAINANANGISLQITHVALGTDKFDSATGGAGLTTMAGRKEAVTIAGGGGVVTGAGGFRVSVLFKSWAGTPATYNATSIGFYAGDPANGGKLFAIYSHPSDVIVLRNALDYVASFNLQLTDVPAGSVTVVVDPSADRALALYSQHESATDPHKGYIKKSGDTATGAILIPTSAQNDDSKAAVNAEFVARKGFGFPNFGGVGANIAGFTLLKSHVGAWVEAQVNFGTITLPKATDCPVGATFQIVVAVPICTLVAAPGDAMMVAGYGALAYQLFCQGETITVTRNQANYWYVVGHGYRMPPGTVSFFAGIAPPPGWLKLNGALLGRDAYPALWTHAQTQGLVSDQDWGANGYWGRFSVGTNGSNFRLPDGRGMFLRSLDDGRGVDAGRGWGTFQDQDNRYHAHGVIDNGHAHSVADPGHIHSAWTDVQGRHEHNLNTNGVAANQVGPEQGGLHSGTGKISSLTTANGEHGHNVGIGASATNIGIYAANAGISIAADGSEARPKNLAYAMCVKF